MIRKRGEKCMKISKENTREKYKVLKKIITNENCFLCSELEEELAIFLYKTFLPNYLFDGAMHGPPLSPVYTPPDSTTF